MFLGIDVSSYLEQKRISHPCYFKNGKKVDPFLLFKNNGVTHIRVRLWNDPYDENGKPYLAGTCDLNNFINLAKELSPYKFKFILDFHYSDFWVDPQKQFLPKAWQNLSFEELKTAVYKFTKDCLEKCKEENIDIDYIQVGNEITHGFLWPHAALLGEEKRGESFDRFAALLNEAIKACNEIYPTSKIIIHLEQSYAQDVYRDIISNILKRNVKIDVIGSSYYPFWHHGFDEYFANMDMVTREFGIPTMNVELGYPFTLLDYKEEGNKSKNKHMVINENNAPEFKEYMMYAPNKEGQANFVKDFISLAKKHHLLGVCYWEPMWIPGEGICWGSIEGQKYQLKPELLKETRVDWANMCLFDYEGNALPALDNYKI